MKILLIGLGRFGSAIARKLLQHGHQILAIESDPSVVEKFLKTTQEDILESNRLRICVGDATSLLVWEYLDLSEFDLIISSLRGGSFNKTVCEIVRDIYKNWDIPIVVLAFDKTYERYFSNYNCKVFLLPEIAASFVEGLTLKNISKPIGIGLGINEILEAVVSPKSPYTKVSINPSRLRHWRLGLIYRGDSIILPRRKITLRAGDRVVILGDDPRVVLEVAKAMALGEPQFPLSFGENLIAALRRDELHYLKEFYYLWKHLRVKNVVLFTDERNKQNLKRHVEDKNFLNSLILEGWKGYKTILDKTLQTQYSAGLISVPYRRVGFFFHNINLKSLFKQETPFLIPKLSFPYKRILVSLNCENPQGMVEQVFELFQLVKGEQLTFLVVVLPEVLLPKKERLKVEKTLKLIEDYAKLYGLRQKVKILKEEGNPKRKTLKFLKEHDLLVVGYMPRSIGFFEPYAPYILAKSSQKSVIGIPTERAEE
ncbi:MAG TPA: TrkA family potassium uptake protein [Aquificales bacterium]|nr:TrkA family potassium uptake protein [Aquificales bacterium]